MRKDVMARRREYYELHLLGIPHPEIIRTLKKKYGVATQTLYNDWSLRKEWLPELVAGDPETFTSELLAEIHASRARLWRMAVDKEVKDAVRLGAYKLILEGIGREVELLQSLGRLPKMADRLEQVIEEERVEHIILENVSEDEKTILEAAARILDKKLGSKKRPPPVY